MKLLLGDNLVLLRELPDNSVDSVVTDPPYGFKFMGKKWDYDVPTTEIWKEVLRVLKPGGHLLAFGGTRTYHRLVVNIEDAGFEIRDQLQWLYGQGFPKSLNVGKEVEAYEGWGTALKPANEPIVLARKPLSEKTVVANVLKWGTGGINVDGCRIPSDEKSYMRVRTCDPQTKSWKNTSAIIQSTPSDDGRFPSNLLLDETAAEMLDEQSGILHSHGGGTTNSEGYKPGQTHFGMRGQKIPKGDSGGASRFFYVAKTSKRERGEGNIHPTVKPIKLMSYLCRLITPPNGIVLDPFMGSGSTGIAAKNEGLYFIGMEIDAGYFEIAEKRINESK